MLEALLLQPGNVLHVLHVVQAVADRGLGHGRGGGETVEILHQDILGGLSRQSVRHITASREIINNLYQNWPPLFPAIIIIQYLSVEVLSPPLHVKVN